MIRSISREELQSLMAGDGVQVVDVLPDAEFTRSHIPGSINIPLRTMDEKAVRGLRRDKPVAVY